MYRLYVVERGEKMWLMDWIVAENIDHPQFTSKRDLAMTFERFDACLRYHRKLKTLGYEEVHAN